MRRLWAFAALLALSALARGPLHDATFALPVSNDDAIPLLIGRHLLAGEWATILWNQPYNGTLDAFLLAPLLAVLHHHVAFRLYEALCAAALCALAFALARRVSGGAAAWAAGALAAVGTPYAALMAATGPTPNFLVPVLVGLVVLHGYRTHERPAGSWALDVGAGLIAGLAVWDSALAVPQLVGAASGLALLGLRPRPRVALAFALGGLLGLSPLFVARAVGASAASTVTDTRPQWLWADGVRDLGHAAAGLAGLELALVVDGPEREALPTAARLALGAGLIVALLAGATRRRALPLVLPGLALAGAFAYSRRTGPDEVRYLYGLLVPGYALAGCGLARLAAAGWRSWRGAGAAAVGLALVAPWALGQWRVAQVWSDPAHAARVWQVPPVQPAVDALRGAGVASAYASLQFAGRLGLEGGWDLRVSQAWNERIPDDPMRFRDEVDLDPRGAWVLHPHLSRGMPRAAGFRGLLAGLGIRARESAAGELIAFHDFAGPWDERRSVPAAQLTVESLAGGAPLLAAVDRDVATGWTSPTGLARGVGLRVRLASPLPVEALVLVVGLDAPVESVAWSASVHPAPEPLTGAIVAQGPGRFGLRYWNGAPRAGRQGVIVVALGGRDAAEIQWVAQSAGPALDLREVFVLAAAAPIAEAGDDRASEALAATRAGRWAQAVTLYAAAARAAPERAAFHAARLRAEWRAARRQRLDVESLADGAPGDWGRARPE
jgi:hypothetical protein